MANAELKTIEPIAVVGIEHKGAYDQIGAKFGEIFGMAGPGGWPIQGSLGIYFNDPSQTPVEDLRSKACIIVPEGFDPGVPGVEAFEVAGGQYVVYRHMGSYAGLGDSWMKVYSEEIPRLKMDDNGPPFEVYVNNCNEVPEDELITDIYVPVKAL
ncbi:MAG TPA: GyrI-like domain-containing protein [Fimbriimonadaceae bacterium]|nr:GyrI-like domain-containing protein [Fimbriimonadaceae bacterium]